VYQRKTWPKQWQLGFGKLRPFAFPPRILRLLSSLKAAAQGHAKIFRRHSTMEDTAGKDASAAPGGRRNEDIALDLMKFVAMTAGYGKTAAASGAGFQGGGAASKPEEYTAQLLDLYRKCLDAVKK
jgi:hypothetical protein